jgi:TolB-like protein
VLGPRRGQLIGRFRLDADRGLLLDTFEGDVRLRPKAFHVLRVLAERRGSVVGRDELLDRVWLGVHVTDDSVTQCIGEIRRALGASGAGVLRTVAGRGYVLDRDADAPGEDGGLPSIAVLPFVGLGHAAATALAAALTDDLAVGIARLGQAAVVLPPQRDAGAVEGAFPARLGASHHLRGSVRIARAGQARVTAQLVEARRGTVGWADSFDRRAASGVFLAGHDELVAEIALAVCSAAK